MESLQRFMKHALAAVKSSATTSVWPFRTACMSGVAPAWSVDNVVSWLPRVYWGASDGPLISTSREEWSARRRLTASRLPSEAPFQIALTIRDLEIGMNREGSGRTEEESSTPQHDTNCLKIPNRVRPQKRYVGLLDGTCGLPPAVAPSFSSNPAMAAAGCGRLNSSSAIALDISSCAISLTDSPSYNTLYTATAI